MFLAYFCKKKQKIAQLLANECVHLQKFRYKNRVSPKKSNTMKKYLAFIMPTVFRPQEHRSMRVTF